MNEWKETVLGDVALVRMGQSPPGHLVKDLQFGTPFLQGNAEFGAHTPEPRYECDDAPRQADHGDTLISVRAPVGAINQADRNYRIGRGLAAIRFSAIDSGFGKHALRHNARQLALVSQGTTFAAIGGKELRSLPISVPPLEEQRRIAEILDTIDETIQATERVIAKLTLERSALIESLLANLVTTDQQPLGDLAVSSVDGPFGSALTSAHYVSSPGVRLVRLSNLGDGAFINEDKAFISQSYARVLERHDVRPRDLLIASLGDYRHRTGRACLYPDTESPGIVKADCFRFRLDLTKVAPEFLALRVNRHDIARKIARLSGGVTRDRVNLGNLRRIVIPIPSLDDQRRTSRVVKATIERLTEEDSQLNKLRSTRSGLAADLLSGRVRTVAS
jgi:type I restriction enzyme, S subunit